MLVSRSAFEYRHMERGMYSGLQADLCPLISSASNTIQTSFVSFYSIGKYTSSFFERGEPVHRLTPT